MQRNTTVDSSMSPHRIISPFTLKAYRFSLSKSQDYVKNSAAFQNRHLYISINITLLLEFKKRQIGGITMIEKEGNTVRVNCEGETCPVPLVETRKALRQASPGDIVEIVGTHPASKKEIPMAVEALGLKVLDISEENGKWKIRIIMEKR
jgi:TusA-related sulfurtransferase